MRDVIRVGVVGGGGIAKAHVIGLRSLRSYFGADGLDADVVAIADADADAAREAADAYQVGRWTTDWRDLLADDTVDAVTIATPNDLHAPIAIAAAEAGKHVLCEKPLAHDVEAGRRMLAAVEAAGVVHSVNLNYRNVPALRYAKHLVDGGALGQVVSFRGAFLQDWGADPGVPRSWKFEARRAGAGPLLSLGCHVIDLAHHLVGDIAEVVASTRTWITERPLPESRDTYASGPAGMARAPVDVEDSATVLLRFRHGATGTLETSRIAPGRANHCFVEINGTHGTVVFDYERLNELHVAIGESARLGLCRVVIGPEQDGGVVWTLGGLGVGFADTVALHMRGFVGAIAAGTPCAPDFRDGLRAQEVVHAALRSSASRGWEAVADVP